MLVIMYKNDHGDDGAIHSAADFEFEDATALRAFMRHAMVHAHYCMLKLTAIGIRKPGDAKVALHVQRLHDKSVQDKTLVMQDFESLIAVGMVVDVTKELAEGLRMLDQGAKSMEGRYDIKGLNCWVGKTRKVLDTGEKIESLSAPVDVHPDSVKFGYLERRREERYMLQTQVDIAFKGCTFSGVTQDISVRGLQVRDRSGSGTRAAGRRHGVSGFRRSCRARSATSSSRISSTGSPTSCWMTSCGCGLSA